MFNTHRIVEFMYYLVLISKDDGVGVIGKAYKF